MEPVRDILEQCWKALQSRLSLVLLALGAVLLAYVGWAYGSMYLEQRRLAQEWQRQQQPPQAQQATSTDTAPGSPADNLTRLSVPKINLESVVVEGVDNHALRLGPGHMRDTPQPGEGGNSVISGHRDTFFRHLNDLEMGDEVLVQRGGKTFHYKVTGKRVVQPTDVDVLAPTKDSEMTLITCYPTYYIGPAPKRLVVFSKLVPEVEQTSAR